MSLSSLPILVVDDEKNMRVSLKDLLEGEGYEVRTVESAEAALELLGKERFFLGILDGQLGGMSGYELLSRIRQAWPQMMVLMITAYATPSLAVEAIKAGAKDYLSKPYAPEQLLHSVSECARIFQLQEENATLRAKTQEAYRVEQIVGDNPKIKELRRLIQVIAPSNATVLILGESGTGKELIAGAIHSLSARRDKPYIRINCAAIPEALLESELFGHEKGAFTGAIRLKLGRVEEADGGTIFLDEIGDMSRPLQAKLLRFLENGTFSRVGGNEELHVNVRLIAATNRNIVQAIKDQEFREDLFHRLNVMQLTPPPLRARGSDILQLAEHFLQHFSPVMNRNLKGFSSAAKQKLLGHHWPGNVRELRNSIERAVILEPTNEIQAGSLPDFQVEAQLRRSEGPVVTGAHSLDELLSNFERDLITQALHQNNESLTRTAEQLKITRHALRYRMQRLNINGGQDVGDEGPASKADNPSE
ncbi:MAG: sigma-54-dependent Fis family transcriptional regulator [Verrucomicrobiales bacterium]|nr:sigma-54-dependent Fis family transcriptional regulator [Verrucomicrobiales bacterium]